MDKPAAAYVAFRSPAASIVAMAFGLMAHRLEAAPNAAAAGKLVYDHYCGTCHDIGIGARNGEGPPLNGILGMPAGNMPGYAYSTAIRRSAVVWTAAGLADFIADPRGSIPGNHMHAPGVGSSAERDAIVSYLARFSRDGSMKAK